MRIACCADVHLSDRPPYCYRSMKSIDWIDYQLNRLLDFFSNGCDEYYIAGDLFHSATGNSEYLLNRTKQLFDDAIEVFGYTPYSIVLGNHDFKYNSPDAMKYSPVNLVTYIQDISASWLFNYGVPLHNTPKILTHMFIYNTDLSFAAKPNMFKASDIMDAYEFDILVSGDNHTPFVYQSGNRFIINPGCLTPRKYDETETPGYYIYDSDVNSVERVVLEPKPFDEKEFSLQTSITKFKKSNEIGRVESFRESVNRVIQKKRVNEEVKTEVYRNLEN